VTEDTSEPTATRRRYLLAGSALAAGALAGCAGGAPTNGGSTDSSGPADVPDDASCAVCQMKPAKYPDYNAQLDYEQRERRFFCSSGCMAAFAAVPGHFDEAYGDATLASAWVHDHATKEYVDGRSAHYVIETNADRVDDPMMKNPLPFANREDAVAYVEQYDDLSEEDIVAFEDFDRELAESYRAKFF
jgi:nitrous oxide reductase accessory protein NosL